MTPRHLRAVLVATRIAMTTLFVALLHLGKAVADRIERHAPMRAEAKGAADEVTHDVSGPPE